MLLTKLQLRLFIHLDSCFNTFIHRVWREAKVQRTSVIRLWHVSHPCVIVSMHTHTCTHTHVRTHTHMYMYTHTHTHTHAPTHTCAHTHTHTTVVWCYSNLINLVYSLLYLNIDIIKLYLLFISLCVGFAIDISIILAHPNTFIGYASKAGMLETDFLAALRVTVNDLEAKANDCKEVSWNRSTYPEESHYHNFHGRYFCVFYTCIHVHKFVKINFSKTSA